MKRLLILNGGISEVPLIEKAKEMGFYVITTGNAPNLIGHKFSDEYIPCDYSNKEAILSLVKKYNIDRIVSCANDFGVITAAYVAEKMGWPGHDTYETALLLHQKDRFKSFIQSLNIATPTSVSFFDKSDAVKYIDSVEYPIIVKSSDLTGGKGVMKAENKPEAIIAINNAFSRSRVKHIVIEPFIAGFQQALTVFIRNKRIICHVSNDSFSPINPYLIQSELFPANGIDKYYSELERTILQICKKLDLVDGLLTIQYIVNNGKPYIIELMRRALGNQYLTVADVVSGFPWEEALIRAETGMDLSTLNTGEPIAKFAGFHGIMATKNGIVKGYRIPDSIEQHLFKKIETLNPRRAINDYMNERIAYIYYKYNNYDEALNDVLNMNKLIEIEYGE